MRLPKDPQDGPLFTERINGFKVLGSVVSIVVPKEMMLPPKAQAIAVQKKKRRDLSCPGVTDHSALGKVSLVCATLEISDLKKRFPMFN